MSVISDKEIEFLFKSEFGPVIEKFKIINLSVKEAANSDVEHIWKPGVYVFLHTGRGVIRVGRSLDNSRKRALQHIPANTGGTMNTLISDENARLLLFNVKDPKDYHWVAAVEIYFENELKPEIPTGRQG